MIGDVLGGYRLNSKLGEGGTGETYLAEKTETGDKAAVKVLFPALSGDSAVVSSFFAEVRAVSQVNHVGIVDLYECGVHDDGRAFVVLEYLEGKTLTDALIELGSVSDIESFADIAWQLSTLLAAVHAGRIVHGSLKPDGIFLTFPASQAPRPLVKLLDFGMARFSLSVRHSQTGSLLGAPLYMSPEIARGLGNVDHRADIYSLGCILFEMACGRPPFVREGRGELIIAHASETPPSVSSLEPSVPAAIDTLIGRMLTKNPATRPQSMAEVAAVLERFFKCPAPGAVQEVQTLPAAASAAAPVFPSSPELGPAASRLSGPLVVHFAPLPPQLDARKPDPTALLPPSEQAGVMPVSSQTWVARVQQRTAILPPSSNQIPSAVSAHPAELSSRSETHPRPRPAGVPGPARAGAASASSISVPIVVATAAIVLVASVGIYWLLRRKSPQEVRSPAASPPAAVEAEPTKADPVAPPFVPPVPPHTSAPTPLSHTPPPRLAPPTAPSRTPRRSHTTEPAQPLNPTPEVKRHARRW